MWKKYTAILIVLLVLSLLFIKVKLINNSSNDTINKISTSNLSKIEIDFKEYYNYNNDNVIQENIINLQKKDINKIYYTKKYDSYEFLLCLDINNTLHIAYSYSNSYYSIYQIANWTDNNQYIYESSEGNGITKFENILGYSGVKFSFLTGAASNNVCYIAIEDHPFLLLAESLSGDFTEYDINEDGQKELLAFDGYMYIKINDIIYKATYNFNKNTILQIIFNDETHQYNVIFSNGSKREYKYDSKQKCLKEIE